MTASQAGAAVSAPLGTSLCPAGHLPLKGGDWLSSLISPLSKAAGSCRGLKLLISPLEGEMSGRTEEGVKRRRLSGCSAASSILSG
jgi:hypothetical protein